VPALEFDLQIYRGGYRRSCAMRLLRLSALTAAVAAGAIGLTGLAEAQPYGLGMMGGWGGDGYWPFGMMILWLLVLVAIVAGVVLLVRAMMPGERSADVPRSAGLAVLEERYAKGEVNRDEYLQKKKDIVG
jgi:putative membrane protein